MMWQVWSDNTIFQSASPSPSVQRQPDRTQEDEEGVAVTAPEKLSVLPSRDISVLLSALWWVAAILVGGDPPSYSRGCRSSGSRPATFYATIPS